MEPITRKEIYLNQIAKNTGGSGGDTGLTPITREEHYFDAIVKNTASGGGGGSDLPAVTSEDNGDVLTVVNGAWDKAAPSGGDTVVLHLDEETFALDKTWQEITDLLAAGKRLVFYFPYDGSAGGTQVTIVSTSVNPYDYAVWSFGYMVDSGQPDWSSFVAVAETANSYPYLD